MSHYHITRGEPHVAGAQDLKTGLITRQPLSSWRQSISVWRRAASKP
jgi:hypothetical protein